MHIEKRDKLAFLFLKPEANINGQQKWMWPGGFSQWRALDSCSLHSSTNSLDRMKLC